MRFELLEALMGIEPWIQVIQADHKSDRHPPIGHVVDETATEFFVAERPAHGVNDAASGLLLFRNVPDFLDADSIDLGIATVVEIEFPDELLGQRPAGALCEDGNLRADIDSRFEILFWLTELIDTLVAGSYAYKHVSFDEKIRSGESGKNVDAALFNLLAEPASEFVQRDDVIPVILKG